MKPDMVHRLTKDKMPRTAGLPVDPLHAGNEIEVLVAAQYRQAVLASQGGLGRGRPDLFHFPAMQRVLLYLDSST